MHSKCRICIVAHLADLSGANKSLIDLCVEYRKRNINFIVVIPRRGLLSDRLDELGIKYKILYYTTWIDGRNQYIKRTIKRMINFFSQFLFLLFCKKEKIAIVHYNSISVGVGACLLNVAGIPCIWHIREYIDNKHIMFHSERFTWRCLRKAFCLIAVSSSIQEQYKYTLNGANWRVIKNGIKLPEIYSYTKEQYRNIIIVGGVERNKGQIQAVDILRRCNDIGDIKLYIVGPINDQRYYSDILKKIKEYKLQNNVFFTGYQENVEIYREKCAIALVCSEYESFGRVTVEAMACGELVIGANTGGTAEIIKDGHNGLLYLYGDQNSLYKVIENAILFPEQYVKLIQVGRKEAIEKYSIKNTVDRIEELYDCCSV